MSNYEERFILSPTIKAVPVDKTEAKEQVEAWFKAKDKGIALLDISLEALTKTAEALIFFSKNNPNHILFTEIETIKYWKNKVKQTRLPRELMQAAQSELDKNADARFRFIAESL